MRMQGMRFAVLLALAVMLPACAGGSGSTARQARAQSRYSHTLHDRFYEAWQQPPTVGATYGKVSVPVDVEINARGRIVSFALVRPSGYPRIDASIRAVRGRVRRVPPPPGLAEGATFRLRINFDLDVKR